MKVAVAGSHSIKDDVAPFLRRFLSVTIPKDEEIILLLRRGRWTKPGPVEQRVAATLQGPTSVQWRTPNPGPLLQGRGSVYARDIEMIEEADMVILFFTEGEEVDGYSGTAHLLDRALIANKKVFAYTVDSDARIIWLGDAT